MTAIINPRDIVHKVIDCPRTIVTCFTENLILNLYLHRIIVYIYLANGRLPNIGEDTIGLIMSIVGAPAVVCLFAMGIENIVVFGTCGVLDQFIEDCAIFCQVEQCVRKVPVIII